jgi:hypothetical protein
VFILADAVENLLREIPRGSPGDSHRRAISRGGRWAELDGEPMATDARLATELPRLHGDGFFVLYAFHEGIVGGKWHKMQNKFAFGGG